MGRLPNVADNSFSKASTCWPLAIQLERMTSATAAMVASSSWGWAKLSGESSGVVTVMDVIGYGLRGSWRLRHGVPDVNLPRNVAPGGEAKLGRKDSYLTAVSAFHIAE